MGASGQETMRRAHRLVQRRHGAATGRIDDFDTVRFAGVRRLTDRIVLTKARSSATPGGTTRGACAWFHPMPSPTPVQPWLSQAPLLGYRLQVDAC